MSEIITVRALSSSPSTATTSNFLLDRRMSLAGSGLFDGGEGAMTPNPSLRRRSCRSFTLPDCGLLASTQTIPFSGADRVERLESSGESVAICNQTTVQGVMLS